MNDCYTYPVEGSRNPAPVRDDWSPEKGKPEKMSSILSETAAMQRELMEMLSDISANLFAKPVEVNNEPDMKCAFDQMIVIRGNTKKMLKEVSDILSAIV